MDKAVHNMLANADLFAEFVEKSGGVEARRKPLISLALWITYAGE